MSDPYHWHVEAGAEAPSLAVVDAVSMVEGVEPTELSPLGDTVDTEALDVIVRSGNHVETTVRYQGYQVTIRGAGDIELQPVGRVPDDEA